jgi:DNA repair exonuclease SbcCD ATPase subunit
MNKRQQLEARLKLIEAKLEELRAELARSRLTVNEYCSELVTQVDIYIETRIQELNELRKKLLQQIKEFEERCVRDMEATKSELEASLEKTKKWVQSIRDFRNTEQYLSELTQQSDEHLSKLKALLFELKGYQFGGELLHFDEGCCTRDKESLLKLSFKSLRVPPSIESYFTRTYSTPSSN